MNPKTNYLVNPRAPLDTIYPMVGEVMVDLRESIIREEIGLVSIYFCFQVVTIYAVDWEVRAWPYRHLCL